MVAIKDFMINGTRMDTNGVVQRYINGKVEVQINSVYLQFDESRLEDYEIFWEQKKKETK